MIGFLPTSYFLFPQALKLLFTASRCNVPTPHCTHLAPQCKVQTTKAAEKTPEKQTNKIKGEPASKLQFEIKR